jgi:putative PIN family toxin of toxin-antitoxin system
VLALFVAVEAEMSAVLSSEAVWFEPIVRVTDCRDPKDDMYLELALAAGAETIVSSDDDLLVLHPWRGVRILRPADYLSLF